jgi:Uma2 family endonuclease
MATRTDLRPGERIPMSWEDYQAFTVEGWGEYIDGAYVHMNSATQPHQRICRELLKAIDRALPAGVDVLCDWGWKPSADLFVPDLLVFDRTDEDAHLTALPHLAVEVLSSDTAADTIRKHRKYAQAGLPRYWIIDPDGPQITVCQLQGQHLVAVAHHQPGATATLDLGAATLTLDPGDLLTT